ncbi:MAG: T9SS type A sorting domain-containing protein, partial [Bacteroidetes bacterium]|nr:T9SS type A sorting domain-containing protein [Bacteroidota bacterium]
MRKLVTLLIALFLTTTIVYGQLSVNSRARNLPQKQQIAATGHAPSTARPLIAPQRDQSGTTTTGALQHMARPLTKNTTQFSNPTPEPQMPKAPGAWVSTWYFSQTPGTYTAITGGTVFGTTASDEQVYGTYDIGFNFSYNGAVYTKFSVATNGFIGLGNTAVTTQTLPISAAAGSNNVISALGLDLQGQTGSEMRYQMIGTAPARTLVVQWTNFRKKSATGDVFNFQIRLNENNNSIAVVYNTFTVNGTNSTPQVGIRGASNADYNNRLGNTTYATWAESGPGIANNSTCRLRAAVKPADGQTYGWTPYAAQTATLPISENFDGVATGTMPVGWSIANSNSDFQTWGSGSSYPNTEPNSMQILYNSAAAMNDWFFSPKINMIASHTYKVSFYYTNTPYTTNYPEKLEVKYGAAATAAGMTSAAIFSNSNITSMAYTLGTGNIVPATTGDYYVGWHGFSAADQFFLFVDDITITEVVNNDVGPISLMNPVMLPASQNMPWFGAVQNFGFNTETFTVDTKLRENTVLSSTQTNTVTALVTNATSRLSGSFNLSSLGAASTFDLSIKTNLGIDEVTANDLLTNYTRPCRKDTAYAWDDGVGEGSIGFNTGSGWLGQLYYLSAQDTLTSITVKWGTIPGALAGNSFEIYNVSGGLPSTKFADIISGINLTVAADSGKLKTYKATTPVILPAGTYWIGAHQTTALSGTYLLSDDMTGLNVSNYLSGFAFYSSDGSSWSDYTASGLQMFNMLRPNFANIIVPFVANPTAFTATAVSSTEVDLSWALNGDGDDVLVAWNTSNTFGIPSGSSYLPGSAILGGGTVLQFNAATSYNHTGRDPNTRYYYKAWSYNGSIYSGGATSDDITFCAETPAPWTQDFELATFAPTCWGLNVGSGIWARSTACSGYGTGTGCAIADFFNITGSTPFALFTLPFNKGTLLAPALKFDYAYATYSGQVDEMDVYYSTDGGANFNLLLAMPGGTSGILNTGGTQNTSTTVAWVPTSAQWATQTLILPVGTNMIAFNATSAYGNSLYLDNVRIVEGPLHDVGVASLEARSVFPAGTVNPVATVRNYGGSYETFNVTMTIGAYSSTQTVTGLAPGLSYVVNFDPWTAAIGNYTETVTTSLSDENAANNTLSKPIKVIAPFSKQVYGYTTYTTTDNGPITFDLNDPGTITEIVNDYPVVTYPAGGSWANGKWYGSIYATAAPYNLVTFNPATGARTVIGDMGVNINAMSYNKANGIMYGVSFTDPTSSLYTINLTTGTATLVAPIGAYLIINMAINTAGVCYATDLSTSTLGTINLSTGAFTAIGPIGFTMNYAQDMEFDRETGELYMAAYGTTGQLRWVDITTGNTLLIGDFQDGVEVTGFAIPYSDYTPIVLSGSATDVTICYGNTNGAVTTNVTGGTAPYTYLWSNGATTSSLTGIGAGTYSVTVSDVTSFATGSWTVNQPSAILLSGTPTDASCPTGADGSIALGVAGGTPAYSFLWSNGPVTQNLSGLNPGTYTVTVTDANGCYKTGSYTVGQASAVCDNITVTGKDGGPNCYNAVNTITVAGGTTTYLVQAPGGDVTFIAGHNILFEPGTTVESGAKMVGKISMTFCPAPTAPMTAAVTSGTEESPLNLSNTWFTLYPNPTNGNFTLVQKGEAIYGTVKVDVYSMSGEKVMTEQMVGEKKHEFRFSDIPVGLYFVRVV